ncbi:hypothetical protein Dimus_027386 [Dionaea muscipula]
MEFSSLLLSDSEVGRNIRKRRQQMAEKQPHALFKIAKLLLLPTAAAAGAGAAAIIIPQLLPYYYYYYRPWNPIASSSSSVTVLLLSIRRLLQSPPLVYLLLNLIIISILLSSTSSLHNHRRIHNRGKKGHSVHPHQFDRQLDRSGEGHNYEIVEAAVTSPPTASMKDPRQRQRLVEMASAREGEITPITVSTSSFGRRRWSSVDQDQDQQNIEKRSEDPIAPEEVSGGGSDSVGSCIISMDEMWRAITEEGKAKEATRQLTKSETWSSTSASSRVAEPAGAGGRRGFKKSETFNDGFGGQQRRGLRWKEVLSEEELNRRAEAFISKFRGDIWLQRKESDDRFLKMINGGL